ncbi:MAG: putative metal-binding motif-containing protein [Sandaracinaceae bacterium]|nr:putative metal-binding motif-containing protein [Sandaracinaceae bacterium]
MGRARRIVLLFSLVGAAAASAPTLARAQEAGGDLEPGRRRAARERARDGALRPLRRSGARGGDLLARADLSPSQRNAAMEVQAIILLARRQSARAEAVLRELYGRDPEHRLIDRDVGPAIRAAFERVQASRPPRTTVQLENGSLPRVERRQSPVLAVRIAEGGGVVHELRLSYRNGDSGPFERVLMRLDDARALGRARIPLAEGTDAYVVQYYVEALAPSQAVIGSVGSESEPLSLEVPAEAAVPAVAIAPSGEEDAPAPAGPSVLEEWWFWTIVGLVVAGGRRHRRSALRHARDRTAGPGHSRGGPPVSRRAAWTLLALSVASCSDGASMLVEVTSDFEAPAEIDHLRIQVRGATSGSMLDETFELTSPFPHSYRVHANAENDDEAVTITVTGLSGTDFVVRRVVGDAFVPGGHRTVTVHLPRDCIGVMCDPGVDCVGGRCMMQSSDGGLDGGADAATDGGCATDCDDGIECTIDRCELGECVNEPDDGRCLDGDRCHPAAGCREACTGDEECDDGRWCTGTEVCEMERCVSVSPPDCDDGIACTVDGCDDDVEACTHEATDSLCDDGDVCNGAETCDVASGCATGTPLDCDDESDCTVDSCTSSMCAYVTRDADMDGHGDALCPSVGGVAADDCDDTSSAVRPGAPELCNGTDDDCDGSVDEGFTCAAGEDGACTTTCGSTGTRTCSAACSWSVCAAPVEICNGADDDCNGAADDGFACVQGEVRTCTTSCGTSGTRTCDGACALGDCMPPLEICEDGVDQDCDGVDPLCASCPGGTDTECDDGLPCNGVETCYRGLCAPGTPLVCDDEIRCTVDTCVNSAGGCVYTPDDRFCEDGNFCNGAETCDAALGCRPGGPPTCDDASSCTEDVCAGSAPGVCRNTTRDLDDDGHGDATCTASGGVPADDCDDTRATVYTGAPELCNGTDDDCDGACDDGFACCQGSSGSCTTTCGTTGTRVCSSVCSWGLCSPPAETCNGVDDDCNGACDDSFACCQGSTGTCLTSCGSMGSRTCGSSCGWGSCNNPAEICSGVDDDCDGSVDEGFTCRAGSMGSCTTSCGSTGVRTCTSSCEWGTCTPPPRSATAQTTTAMGWSTRTSCVRRARRAAARPLAERPARRPAPPAAAGACACRRPRCATASTTTATPSWTTASRARPDRAGAARRAAGRRARAPARPRARGARARRRPRCATAPTTTATRSATTASPAAAVRARRARPAAARAAAGSAARAAPGGAARRPPRPAAAPTTTATEWWTRASPARRARAGAAPRAADRRARASARPRAPGARAHRRPRCATAWTTTATERPTTASRAAPARAARARRPAARRARAPAAARARGGAACRPWRPATAPTTTATGPSTRRASAAPARARAARRPADRPARAPAEAPAPGGPARRPPRPATAPTTTAMGWWTTASPVRPARAAAARPLAARRARAPAPPPAGGAPARRPPRPATAPTTTATGRPTTASRACRERAGAARRRAAPRARAPAAARAPGAPATRRPRPATAPDDDCDTLIDEGFTCAAGSTSSCLSSCGTTGMRTCSASCGWGACVPPAETCNGADDDCDGLPDDGFTCVQGASGSCSTSCGSTGSRTCSASCAWGTCNPPAESCNGADDDCDGTPDEDFVCVRGSSGSCLTSCGSTGARTCGTSCTWNACVPPAEMCNGADDDCDGLVDDGFTCAVGSTQTCTSSCGSTGTQTCTSSCGWGTCTPPTEVCNGVDDDCDGMIDDGFTCVPGATRSCTASCGTAGIETCTASCGWGTCAPPAETCNGADDDCDGLTDDGFACAQGSTGSCTSSCGTTGSRTCSASCAWGSCNPPAEACNGADDDCDGTCDDGFACCRGSIGSCTTGCGSVGSRSCSSTCAWGTCNPPAETCNGADDDCDGSCDNGFTCCAGATGSCTTSCGSTGSRTCSGTCTWGSCAAPAETCNGADDDCDGACDDGFTCCQGSTSSCTTSCGSTGTRTCNATCTGYGSCAAPAEDCTNGADDDCDGSADCMDTDCATHPACASCAACAGATPVGPPGGRYTVTLGADAHAGSCGGSGGSEAYLSLSIGTTSDVFIATHGAGVDTVVYVRNCNCTGTERACNDNADGYTTSMLRLTSLPAGDYQIIVDTKAAMSASVDVHVYVTTPGVESDRCGNPTLVPAGATSVTGSTCTYSSDYLPVPVTGSCYVSSGGDRDRVYYFVVPTTRSVTFSSGCLSGQYDQTVFIRSICTDETLGAQMSCNDDSGCGGSTACNSGRWNAGTTVTLSPGLYFFFADGYYDGTTCGCGSYNFTVTGV